MEHVLIIGNGISGITAARWIRKLSGKSITVISSETEYFYSRTALMYIFMGHMRFKDTQPYEEGFWNKNKIDLVQDHITEINFQQKKVVSSQGRTWTYDHLILALGSKSNKFGWPGQDLDGVSGLYHISDLETMERFTRGLKRAVVVGGGLIGIEMAEMFLSRDVPVTMIVREENYWDNVLPREEAAMISKHIRDHHIDLRLSSNLQEIIDDGNGRVKGVVIKDTGERIDCGFVGLTPGVSPNVDFLRNTDIKIDKGIEVDALLQTNMPGVYAIGDCAQLKQPKHGRRSVEAVWYTGRMMGETVAHTICGDKTPYDPGIWFNSAKFLDIEYQVYGTVPNILEKDQESFFWNHPSGLKSLRIVFGKDLGHILGINLLGLRFRHDVCNKWLEQKSHVEDVLANLALAHFDPEFCDEHVDEIISHYNRQNGKDLKPNAVIDPDRSIAFIKEQ